MSRLEELLRGIYDDDDFVNGCIDMARTDDNRNLMSKYIEKHRNDDPILLARTLMIMAFEMDTQYNK